MQRLSHRRKMVELAALVALTLQIHCGGKSDDPFATIPGNASSGGAASMDPASGGAAAVAQTTGFGGVATAIDANGTSVRVTTGGATMSSPVAATGGKAIPPAPECTSKLNLLTGDLGPKNNWIGGDPQSSLDNPCGVQGQIYKMGDAGPDRIRGNADDTCPYLNQADSPCFKGRCCVSGTTRRWVRDSNGALDFNDTIWGCGIGISLNDPDDGKGTLPYAGPAKGFAIQLSGTLNGQAMRLSYTQVAATATSPFVDKTTFQQYELPFLSVQCPYWTTDCTDHPIGSHPHALQIWVVGGDVADDFELCIDGIFPIL